MDINNTDTATEGAVGFTLGAITYYMPKLLAIYTLQEVDVVATAVFHILSALIAIATIIDMGRKKFKNDKHKTPPTDER